MRGQTSLDIPIVEREDWIGQLEHAEEEARDFDMGGLDKGVEERHAPLQAFVKEALHSPELPGDERCRLDINQISNVSLGDVRAECHVVNESCPEETEFIQVYYDGLSFGAIGILNPESECQVSIKT